MTPRGPYRTATIALAGTLVLLGLAMLVLTIARGGGLLSYGMLAGVLFVAAGAARLWLALKGPPA